MYHHLAGGARSWECMGLDMIKNGCAEVNQEVGEGKGESCYGVGNAKQYGDIII